MLSAKADEAAQLQLPMLEKQEGENEDQFRSRYDGACDALRLVTKVIATTGDWKGGPNPLALEDESLPDHIAAVEFNSSLFFRAVTRMDAANCFVLTLDFTRSEILDLNNLYFQPTNNRSGATITGQNETWVNGVYKQLETFFEGKRTGYGWLHTRYAYDVLLQVIGFPLSFFFTYLMDRLLRPAMNLPDGLFVALYVYFVLVGLLAFRIVFNYAKWLFPLCELREQTPRAVGLHRTVLAGILGGFGTLVLDGFLALSGSSLRQVLRELLK
jgi:hypothetical protein